MNQESRILRLRSGQVSNHGKLKFTIHQSLFTNHGFTLIELLIVIAILGIIAAGIVTALNVTGTIGKANLAKAKTFAASIENDLSIAQVGKWSFDDDTNPGKDTSGYGNNGTVNGATWQNASSCGLGFRGCLSFDGANDYLDAGNAASLNISGKMSISVWFNANSLGGNNLGIVQKGDVVPGAAEVSFSLRQVQAVAGNADSVAFGIHDGGNDAIRGYALAPATLVTNRWYHLVGTYGGGTTTASVRIYLDGLLMPVDIDLVIGSFSSMTTASISLDIGRAPVSGVYNYFNGTIDEVAIYNQALTAYQIREIYAQGLIRHVVAKK